MTVAELIGKLSRMDQGRRVMIPGYEGGYDDVGKITEFVAILNYHDDIGVFGPHADRSDDDPGDHDTAAAVLLAS